MNKDGRVYLRALEPDDYLISVAWRNDEEINSMLGGMRRFVSAAYEAKWVDDAIFHSTDVRLAICLRENGLYIGNVYMTNIDELNQSCISHILIGNKQYWGQGIAAEAYRLALDYMFDERHIHRVVAVILETNKASLRMHEKVGYKIEGLMRHSIYKQGQWQNQYILALLNEEYKRMSSD